VRKTLAAGAAAARAAIARIPGSKPVIAEIARLPSIHKTAVRRLATTYVNDSARLGPA
jgi:hypothetical protein